MSDAGPLWSGRLAGGLDPRVLAYSQSLSVDGRLLPYDVRASKAHVRMLGAAGHHPGRRRRRHRGGARPGGAGRARDRRGRPLADRAPAGRAAGRDRQARARRSLAQRPGGDRVPPLLPGRRPRSGRRAWPVCRPCSSPRARVDGDARAAGLHAPAARAAAAARPPPGGARVGAPARCRAAARGRSRGRRARRSAPVRWPAPASRSIPTAWRARPRLRRAVPELASTPSRTATSRSTSLRLRPLRRAPLADRGGARAVDVAGVRVRGARRRRRARGRA